MTYLPHFCRGSSCSSFDGVTPHQSGMINDVIKAMGGQPILSSHRPPLVPPGRGAVYIWKETGWSTILTSPHCSASTRFVPESPQWMAHPVGAAFGTFHCPASFPLSCWSRFCALAIPRWRLVRSGFCIRAGGTMCDIIDTWVYRSGVLDFHSAWRRQ